MSKGKGVGRCRCMCPGALERSGSSDAPSPHLSFFMPILPQPISFHIAERVQDPRCFSHLCLPISSATQPSPGHISSPQAWAGAGVCVRNSLLAGFPTSYPLSCLLHEVPTKLTMLFLCSKPLLELDLKMLKIVDCFW